MKAALAIAVCGVCAAASAQNAQVQYAWEWSEVLAGTATPSSATPGVIDPTEGVRLTLHALMTPDVGQMVSYTMFGDGLGTAPVHSWGLSFTTLRGGIGTAGAFTLPQTASGFQNLNFDVLSPGVIRFDAISEWLVPPGTVPTNTSNPVQGLISFTWTPSDYSQRTVSFVSEDPITGGAPNQLLVLTQSGSPLLWWAEAIPNHGPGTGGIPIVPGPGAAMVIGLGMMMGRRRRQMGKLANWHMST
jgi:hypothetical protein